MILQILIIQVDKPITHNASYHECCNQVKSWLNPTVYIENEGR